MINTLLEHVPIKMETKDVEIVNNDNDNNDDVVVNSEEEDDDDPDEDDDDEDEEDDEDEDEESDTLDVDQEVTLLISSDEEAELEAQRIRFPEKRANRKKSGDSKSSRCTSRNSNSSNASLSAFKDKGMQKQLPAKEKQATGGDVKHAQQTQQQQRSSPRNKKENNKNLDNLPAAGDLRQAARRQSNNSTCSVASSIASSDSGETESCGNIYVFQEQKKLIFSCEFCDLKYGNLENLSRHLHESHRVFHNDDQEQEKENSPRNLRNKGNQLPPKSQKIQQQALSVKKEPLQMQTTTTTESTLPPVAALSLSMQSEHGLQSCGNVFILNHRKLFLICGHCECKYANVELFEKHLRQQHNVFAGTTACNEVNVVPKTEIKEEVFIITEVVEKAQTAEVPSMVTIPAEIPLDISFTEPETASAPEHVSEIVEQEQSATKEVITTETGTFSSIQIHDSGVTVAEIPLVLPEERNNIQMLISEDTPIDMVMSEATSVLPAMDSMATVVSEKVTEKSSISPKKRTRKRRSIPADTEKTKSPQKRPRRIGRKPEEQESTKSSLPAKPASKPRTTILKKEDNKTKEPVEEEESASKAELEVGTVSEAVKQKGIETRTISPPSLSEVENNSATSTSSITAATGKRKRKPIKTKIEKEDPPPITKPEIVPVSISDRDEEFLEDPVAEIIQQIQNEINSSPEEILPDNPCNILPETLPVAFTNTSSHASSLSPNIKPHISDLNSPVDVKPIIITNPSGKYFVCDQCPRAFKKHVRLIEHKRLHTGEKPFSCDECSKQFRLRMQLTEHKLRHSKQKNFICDVCKLGCCTKQDLNQHMRHHTNDRRFQCTMCPKAFVRSSDLKIHMRVHTGEKPFVCDICHKCFRANQNLSVHKKSHMGDASKTYQCEHCDKKFMRNIDRKVHMRSHTGEKPFKCEICDRAYSSKFNVRAHIERDHVALKGKKKPGPKPKALRDELAKQKKLIEELQNQLLQQIKTDEKIIEDDSLDESEQGEEAPVVAPTSTEQTDTFIISELSSPTSVPLTTIPSPPVLNNNPFTKAKQNSPTVVPLAIKKKIEQKHSSSSSSSTTCSRTPTPPKAATTTKVVSQKTSLGIQQVSVTVSMQVENVPASSTTTPEKENAGISNLQLTTSTTSPTVNASNVKKERKITSYFTVVGQKAEV